MNVKAYRRPGLLLCAAVALPLLGVLLNAVSRSEEIPEYLRIVPPDSSAFLAVPSLRSAWRDASPHITRYVAGGACDDDLSGDVEGPLRNAALGVRCGLEAQGINIESVEDLERNGLDADRPVVLALRGALRIAEEAPVLRSSFVLAVPIVDRGKFELFLEKIVGRGVIVPIEVGRTRRRVTNGEVQLEFFRPAGEEGAEPPLERGASIDRAREVMEPWTPPRGRLYTTAALCGPEIALDRQDRFRLPTPSQPQTLYLAMKEPSEGLQDLFYAFMPADGDDTSVTPVANPIADHLDEVVIAERRYAIRLVGADLCLAYPEPGLAVIFNERSMFQDAVRDPNTNLSTLRKLDYLVKSRGQIAVNRAPSRFHVWGHARQFGVPMLGAATFGLRFVESGVRLNAWLQPETHDSTFLSRILGLAHAEGEWVETILPSAGAAVTLREHDPGYYLRFMKRFHGSAYEAIRNSFGRYGVVSDILIASHSAGRVEAFILGDRDGIPEFAFSLDIDEGEAEDSVRKLQATRRRDRDDLILAEARQQYAQDANSDVRASLAQLKRAGYLIPEDLELWTAAERQWSSDLSTTASPYEPSDFEHESYCGCLLPNSDSLASAPVCERPNDAGDSAASCCHCTAGHLYRYILPPVTENDFRYRLRNVEEDAEKRVLNDDEFRLVSSYNEDNGKLWIALDLRTLRSAFSDLRTIEQVGIALAGARGNETDAKLNVFLNPAWLIDQGLLSPRQEERDFVERLVADIGDYRSLTFAVSPVPRDNALTIRIEVRRD